MSQKTATTRVPVNDLVARRWSPRAFDPDRPVEPEKLAALLEAARWAPSCYGDQPWRFVVFDRRRDPEAWGKAFESLAEANQSWCRNVPVLILALADSRFSHDGQPNGWAAYDTGAASENLCLEAVSQGLVAHQMGGFDPKAAAAACDAPERFVPLAIIAVGYQGSDKLLQGRAREGELAPRQRRALEEIAFSARWNAGFDPGPGGAEG